MKIRLVKFLRSGALLFSLSALEGIEAIAWLLSIPGDGKNQLLFGYSFNRLAIMALILSGSLAFGWLTWKSLQKGFWLESCLDRQIPRCWINPVITAGMLLVFGLAGSLVYLRFAPEGRTLAYYQRLLPLFTWFILVTLQGIIWLVWLRFGFHLSNLMPNRKDTWTFAIVLGFFFAAGIFSLVTGAGIQPDIVDWNGPGVPLLEWQLCLAFLAGAMLILAGLRFRAFRSQPEHKRTIWVDAALGMVIWGLAAGVWLNQPIPQTYFTPAPRLPNNEVYPYSDAADHDMAAQHELIGNGLGHGEVVKRPLLGTFLTLLHLAAGQDYARMVALQTLVLACFPLGLYFLGKTLHSRALGVAIALLALLREVNTIAASPFDQVSDSKMLMSDLPTALGVILFLLLVVVWFKSMQGQENNQKYGTLGVAEVGGNCGGHFGAPRQNDPHNYLVPRKFPMNQRYWLAFLCGGMLGLVMLIRVQSILLAFFLLPLGWLMNPKQWRRWLPAAAIFAIGTFLVLLPWLLRNVASTGKIVFEQSSQSTWTAQRYSQTPNETPPRRSDENEDDYQQRIKEEMTAFLMTHPGYVGTFLASHFLNNTYSTILVLPIRGSFVDIADILTITRKFWSGLGEGMEPGERFLFGVNLLLVGLGIAASWKRWRWIGLIPLAANAAYSLSNAVARNSGWRYMLPTDWAGYFYYMVGLLEIFWGLLRLLGLPSSRMPLSSLAQEKNEAMTSPRRRTAWGWWAGLCLIVLAAGSSIPLLEHLFPKRYPTQTREELFHLLLNQPAIENAGLKQADLEALAADPDVVLLWGRALYPRFYYPGEGEPGTGWKAYQVQQERRLAFCILGEEDAFALLRIDDSPAYFPHAADVIVAACSREDVLDAILVVIPGANGAVYLRSSPDWRTGCAP